MKKIKSFKCDVITVFPNGVYNLERIYNDAVRLAKITNTAIEFTFNDVSMTVTKKITYEHLLRIYHEKVKISQENIAKKLATLAENEKFRNIMQKLPSVVGDQDQLMRWLYEFVPIAEKFSIKSYGNKLLLELKNAGYKPSVHIGSDLVDQKMYAEWIVGEIMSYLQNGIPLSPALFCYLEEYKVRFGVWCE